MDGRLTRRALLVGIPVFLAACQTEGVTTATSLLADTSMYGPVFGEPFPVPAIDTALISPLYYRRTITMLPPHIPDNPGEIVVDPANHYLYHIQADRSAVRYGVGVGREGFGWSGRATIQRKAEWPTWTPPPAMVARDPAARPWANGMPGGPDNPLGARALYLYQGSRDTLYRIHGTNAPASIGQSMSSGCIRLLNQDIIHLYANVPIGTRVTVLSG
ncbi:MAG: L,D-transpeptidase [Bauldia sp.]|nr:L,D-transpeptidase [Bauldia sp.]